MLIAIWSLIGLWWLAWLAWAIFVERREAARRKRFPRRIVTNGEVAFQVEYDGTMTTMPRWEVRVEPNGDLTVLRRPHAGGEA